MSPVAPAPTPSSAPGGALLGVGLALALLVAPWLWFGSVSQSVSDAITSHADRGFDWLMLGAWVALAAGVAATVVGIVLLARVARLRREAAIAYSIAAAQAQQRPVV